MDEKPKRRRGLGPMKPLDRPLALNAGLLGIGAYLLALLARDKGGRVMPLGIGALLCGLIIASLATWRGSRWAASWLAALPLRSRECIQTLVSHCD